ncbi:hypothetical protein FHS21_005221 [Phyllobacterium trifolii]|uniref:DUF6998 domain-containing protein n=1 Tax=Phyllobacterium trifolii TaxID=300193 RepID=A0A839UG71_9HYPH|nr:hypothetical protein [Phyllobacterium trifolii]MBB3148773.1 hypothetical protein [Phyllobacterium trifolii]
MIILPDPIKALYAAHIAMCKHFAHTGLTFTLDGKLVGDIGEAVVAEAFGITLCRQRTPGVDGHAVDGRSVQIKATGLAKAGPAFTPGEGIADHLIFVRIDFAAGNATVLYNGPEAPVRRLLPAIWSGTKVVRLAQVLITDATVSNERRLLRVR